ncbi:TonB-dependent siderophore receptor [Mesorhizobium sp.]|uniref:TonB-dependent siderophore receptor n=1 Tax=Mesorhizobium sp. TaxID=1871066 RepID=UPI0025DFBB4A|nr:TonB-dependent siderophore receptor [Mesorhizobium sp.]
MNRICRMKPLLAGAAIALISPMTAFAQQDNIQLEPVVVEDEAGDSATGPVDGVVAKETKTGSKTATKLTEIPQSVSVIGRQEIDDQGAQKIDESLRYTAGVFTQPFGPDSDTNWLFIRGFDATATGVYMDGLQLFSYGFGGFYIDSFGLERIEVLKGPASVLYGGSNPGGIVNYVSKRPDGRRRYVETGVNDAGNVYLGFDIGDVASDGVVSYRVNGRVADGDTYSDLQDGWRGFISPSITWQPNEQTRLTVLANFSHIDENHNGGGFLPYEGTVTDRIVDGVNYGRIDPDANFTEPSIDLYKREQGSIGYEFEHTFDNDWTVRSNTRFGAASIDEVSVYPNGWASATELDRINFGHDTDVMTFLSDFQIEGKFETGAIEHTLLAGIDYKYYNIDQVQSSALFGTTPPIDAFDPVYGSPLTPRVSYLNQDLTQQQLGFYAQDQLRFGDGWLLTLNGRYDWGWLSADNGPTYYSATSSSQSSNVGDFSGRAGLAYEFDNGITPYASIATFFNPIIGTDANGDLFKPEEGVQYEVGVKYEPTFVDGLFTLLVFDLTRQNVAVASPDNPFAQVQRGEVRSRGVELEGKVNITEDLRVTGAFTAYDLDITKDTNPALIGKTPFIVPELMVSASVDYTFRGDWYDGVSIGAGVRHLGSSWADNENTAKVPAVTLADLKLGYEKENWGVDLNITNLFDKTYVASCQTTLTCSYGEGRSFKLKAHTTW